MFDRKRNRFCHYSVVAWVVAAYLLSGTHVNAQDVNFRHLSIDDELSQNAVYSILQDSRGFMWFGTMDGLNRYDGREFVVYQHNPFDSTFISDAYVSKMLEDSRGNIWTGLLSGVSMF